MADDRPPLLKYPRTPHLQGSRLQPGDEDLASAPLAVLEGASLVIEEKIDGANAAVSFDRSGELLLQSRGHYLRGGPRERHFARFKGWAQRHRRRLRRLLGDRYVLFGEWVYAKHTVFYDQLPHYFLEFDLFDRERAAFLSTAARDAVLDRQLLVAVPVVYRGTPRRVCRASLDELVTVSRFKSARWRERLLEVGRKHCPRISPEQLWRETDDSRLMEGLYVKVEQDELVRGRYKFIRASFLAAVLDSGSHWHGRPVLPNQLAPGVDIYAEPS